MAITIRQANNHDAFALVPLISILGYDVTEIELSKRLHSILSNQQNCILVATEENKVVGFIHVFIKELLEKPLAGENGALAVAEGMQGKGIGKMLLLAGEAWAKEQGCKRLVVKSNVMRQGTHAFYQAVGYTAIKRQVVFEKSL